MEGIPKYFSSFVVMGMLERTKILSTTSSSTLAENATLNLRWLIFCPEDSHKILRQPMIVSIWISFASTKSNKSSTKNNYDIGDPWQDRIMGFHFPSSTAWEMM